MATPGDTGLAQGRTHERLERQPTAQGNIAPQNKENRVGSVQCRDSGACGFGGEGRHRVQLAGSDTQETYPNTSSKGESMACNQRQNATASRRHNSQCHSGCGRDGPVGKPVPGKCCKGVGVGVGRWRVEINKGCNEGFPSTGCGTHVCTPWGARPHVESHHVLETAGSKGARARGHKTHTSFVLWTHKPQKTAAVSVTCQCAASFIKCVALDASQVPRLHCVVSDAYILMLFARQVSSRSKAPL
jgi:hypothetical protein